jgi:hypothetical protein
MKIIIYFLAIIISLSKIYAQDATEFSLDTIFLKDKYLGQVPPRDTPEIFAPGIISTIYHEHSSPNFSPDGKEVLYTLSCEHGHVIMHMKLDNGKWDTPTPVPFSGKYSDDSHVWSNDGSKLYFRSKRPVRNDTIDNGYRNWVVSKSDTAWGEPVLNVFFAYSFSKTGKNYCYIKNEKTDWDIYLSDSATHYQEYEKLDENVNSKNADVTPFIANDESYLIFASMGRDSSIGLMDLYISFKKENGSWTKAKNMGEPINTPGHISRFPRVSPDGKYLFYWSNINNDQTVIDSLSMTEKMLKIYNPWRPENGKDGDVYWVDTEIIEKLKPIDLND